MAGGTPSGRRATPVTLVASRKEPGGVGNSDVAVSCGSASTRDFGTAALPPTTEGLLHLGQGRRRRVAKWSPLPIQRAVIPTLTANLEYRRRRSRPQRGPSKAVIARCNSAPPPPRSHAGELRLASRRQPAVRGDALVTCDPSTRRRGPGLLVNGVNEIYGQARASLAEFARVNAGVLLPGYGEPWRDGMAAAVEQAWRSGGQRGQTRSRRRRRGRV
jgi:hypothetical protein